MNIHGTAVGHDERGVLIIGPSGSGKSSLALSLMSTGATLIADDRVELESDSGKLTACAAPGLEGVIEARGIGILKVTFLQRGCITLVADLSKSSDERLPKSELTTLCGCELPLIRGKEQGQLLPFLSLYLRGLAEMAEGQEIGVYANKRHE